MAGLISIVTMWSSNSALSLHTTLFALRIIAVAAGMVATGFVGVTSAAADELPLAYFMGPKHPMNKGVMGPFGEKLAELSAGKLTVKQFPGGALNKVPPKQYSIMLNGVADIVLALPGLPLMFSLGPMF